MFVYSGGHTVPWKECLASCSMIKMKKSNMIQHISSHNNHHQQANICSSMYITCFCWLVITNFPLTLGWKGVNNVSVALGLKCSSMILVILDARLVPHSLLTTDILAFWTGKSVCVSIERNIYRQTREQTDYVHTERHSDNLTDR